MGGVLTFPFGIFEYHNTDDIQMVSSAILTAAKVTTDRFTALSPSDPGTSSIPISGHPQSGLFYLSSDFSQVYTQSFSLDTAPQLFGSHKDFFSRFVVRGVFDGVDYEAYPRGFAFYDKGSGIYMVIAGAWAADSVVAKICDAFNFDYTIQTYIVGKSNMYTYRNNGDSSEELLIFGGSI
jgi:hypothetical protein